MYKKLFFVSLAVIILGFTFLQLEEEPVIVIHLTDDLVSEQREREWQAWIDNCDVSVEQVPSEEGRLIVAHYKTPGELSPVISIVMQRSNDNSRSAVEFVLHSIQQQALLLRGNATDPFAAMCSRACGPITTPLPELRPIFDQGTALMDGFPENKAESKEWKTYLRLNCDLIMTDWFFDLHEEPEEGPEAKDFADKSSV